jgi:peptidoglycan/LPS O-acetylase OafA/YrhL
MSQRITRTDQKRKKRNSRLITLLWIVSLAVLVIILLYKEKADWLYVLATLGVTVLMVIVALADLSGSRRKGVDEAALGDDAAALGSNIPATTQTAAAASSDWRGTKKRR